MGRDWAVGKDWTLYVPKCNCPTKHQDGKSTDERRTLNDLKSKIRGKITKKVIRSFWGARSACRRSWVGSRCSRCQVDEARCQKFAVPCRFFWRVQMGFLSPHSFPTLCKKRKPLPLIPSSAVQCSFNWATMSNETCWDILQKYPFPVILTKMETIAKWAHVPLPLNNVG